MAIAALIVAIIVPLLSFIVTFWLSRRALQKADRANEIATEALNIEKARLEADRKIFVQPVRYDPNGGQAVYEVLGHQPAEEVVFEFRNYAGQGGRCHRYKVSPGEQRLSIKEFDQDSDLETPGAKQFSARAKWKRAGSQSLDTSGLYLASKANYLFIRHNRP